MAQPTDAAGQRRHAGAIDTGDHVELRLHRGEVLAGRFIRFDRNGLVLEVGNRERFLAADDIDRVWWYDDRSRDFTIGGAIGGAVATGVTTAFFTMDVGGAALGGAAGGSWWGPSQAWWRGRSRAAGRRSTWPFAHGPRTFRCGWTSPSHQRPGTRERHSPWA